MSLKEQSLILIEKGEWIFDLVGPLFRGGLLERTGASAIDRNIALMEITLRAYGISAGEIQALSRTDRVLNVEDIRCEDQETIWKLSESVFPKAIPVPLSDAQQAHIGAAEDYIASVSKLTRILLERWVSTYLLLKGAPFRSASSPHAFGCIFFGEKMDGLDHRNLSVSIVHEMAHQELFLFNLLDRLVETEADFNLVHAPFQGIKRPPIGRLHSLYALFRMVEFERQADLPYARHQQLLFETILSFEEFELTGFAKQLLQSIQTRLDHKVIFRRNLCLG